VARGTAGCRKALVGVTRESSFIFPMLILLVALALITYIPELSLGLVRLLGYADLPVLRHCKEITDDVSPMQVASRGVCAGERCASPGQQWSHGVARSQAPGVSASLQAV
jgi:hypothetical protein